VFLIGVPLAAAGTVGGSTDRVKLLALRSGYALAWSRAFGAVSVSLFVRPPAGAAAPATDQVAPGGGVRAGYDATARGEPDRLGEASGR
jgi:hypothetical protein